MLLYVMRRAQLGLILAGLACALGSAAAVDCAGTPACKLNSDCFVGFCQDGRCIESCADSKLDCPKGYFCNVLSQCELGAGGAGAAASGSGGATMTAATTATATGTTTTAAATTSTATATGAGGGAMGGKHELDLCQSSADCAAGLSCQPMTVGGTMRCTRGCNQNSDCMSGTRCLDRGGKHCFGQDIGKSCAGAGDCNFACLLAPKYCTAPCVSGADCPNGYGCMPVGSPPQSVCVKAEAYCAPNDTGACIAPAACDLSKTLIIGGCTLACNTASDCPERALPLAPWTCDGLCRRPSGVYGSLPGGYTPAQYQCDPNNNPVNVCDDGQHLDFDQFIVPSPPQVNCASNMTTDGAPGDSCVDSCRYQGGCADGYTCVALGDVANQRIGLCLPAGGGEPGAPCSKARDCAFGYCTGNKICSRDCTADGVCPGGLKCVAGNPPAVEGMAFRYCE